MKQPLSISLTHGETVQGLCYLVFSQLLLPSLLFAANALLAVPLSEAKLNFIYYFLNFSATVWILRRYMLQSWRYALRIPFAVIWYAVLGYLACDLLTGLVENLTYHLSPGFFNANNASVFSLLRQEYVLMVLGTVVLAPISEELLYRGVIFRGLYGKSRTWAYILSIVVFAAIHVVGYIGVYSPWQLLLALLQYVPAGYCLCWTYCQTGTIAAPMISHALVNAMTIYYSMR